MGKKLYVFGIGGTGARVIKALTMLLGAGCKLDNGFDTVVPVLIDPDTSNGDLNRTKEILKLYQEIRVKVQKPENFFGQEIKTLSNLIQGDENINANAFIFKLKGTDANKFKEYLNFNGLPREDQEFLKLLYTQDNLNADLNVGFKGNPNMGSIVLNQFTTSKDFQDFGQSFNPGDAIFIINSIFGGTGAAGFPLLLKSLRQGANIPNSAMIANSPIGGLTYLPYFKLAKGEIDSDTFLEKAKAAIDYYNRTIINTNQINNIYFLGDGHANNTYENHVGMIAQKNKAHFLEMAGALAILDFCAQADNPSMNTVVKEYGIENNSKILTLESLDQHNKEILNDPLKKYKLFANYLDNGLEKALGTSRWTIKKTTLDKKYFNSGSYKNEISKYNTFFQEWTKELKENQPAFDPFASLSEKTRDQYRILDTQNCLHLDKTKADEKKDHTQLVKLFEKTTQNVVTKLKL